MEQRKSEAGYMRPYLIEVNGEVCGAVSASRCGTILRLKNLVVDPAHRRLGIATRVAEAFSNLAAHEGAQASGCFAIEGDPGVLVYRKAGYQVMTRQTEWVKEFGTEAR
jgi:ribosomal protein S18 acetylase RimI-like enzyme